ncbi:Mss4-like protein [Phaeosphaeriaceae sp. PMI808]|nr:Mss4-like protein [Phaeosphaeriaceae sp. PMI808]
MASPTATFTGNPNSHRITSFSQSMSASCLFGSIRVTTYDTELFTKPRGHLCHCANCRKVAGSYVASNLAIEKEKVKIGDEKGSGKCVKRCFCGECGNPIMSIAEIYPTMVILKMGIFPRIPQPKCESFALHRHEWQGQRDGLIQFKIARGGKKMHEKSTIE